MKLPVQIAFIIAASGAVYGFVQAAQKDQRRASCTALCALSPAYAGRDRIAPDFELKDLAGVPVKLSSFRGKTVVLNFWTKTCAPCLEEMPKLAELASVARSEKDLVVLTVSTDETPADAIDALRVVLQGPTPFPVLMDPGAEVVREKFGTTLYPETWIIDPSGIIRARFDGARDWSDSLTMSLLRMVGKPSGCPVTFERSTPRGPLANICAED